MQAEDVDAAKRGDSGEKAETNEHMNVMATDTLGVKGALNDYTCGTAGALFKWVDLPEVRAALHVPVDSNWCVWRREEEVIGYLWRCEGVGGCWMCVCVCVCVYAHVNFVREQFVIVYTSTHTHTHTHKYRKCF